MEPIKSSEFCLDQTLAEVEALFPRRGPIKDFVAQNTLQGFLNTPFNDAVEHAAKIFGAKSHMDLSFYRDKYSKQEISLDNLLLAIKHYFPNCSTDEQGLFLAALTDFVLINDQKTFDSLVHQRGFQDTNRLLKELTELYPPTPEPVSIIFTIKKKLACSLDHQVNPIFFRLVGSYTDQGVGLWPFLDQYPSFLKAVYGLAKNSSLPIASFVNNRELASVLALDHQEAVKTICQNILASSSMYAQFIKETLLEHTGWSAMISIMEKNPQSLAKKINISLKDFLLIKLALSWQFIKNHSSNFQPLNEEDLLGKEPKNTKALSLCWWVLNLKKVPPLWLLAPIEPKSLQKIWHFALESQYYQNVKNIIASPLKVNEKVYKKFQAVFCIDDRECSYRRHLEQTSDDVETFGYPGFFGIDCYFKAHKQDMLEKLCPLPITPKHLITEKSVSNKKVTAEKRLMELASFISLHGANSTFFGFISAYTLGHLSLFRLMMSLVHPFQLFKTKKLSKEEKTVLNFEKTSEKTENGLSLGYTKAEMADRVFAALNTMGIKTPAKMVFFIAHGSSSVNNPHFAAYDCGACSGRPGQINSRVLALMANLPEVRDLVREKGIDIPKSTVFIGALHDTCTDEVRFFDRENLSIKHELMLDEFQNHAAKASAKNAKERCKRFSLIKTDISEANALKEVNHRAKALFEPRPELGHANNALCIVGRREKTYQKNFDRRSFLQSYDPFKDSDGAILSSLMSAIIPVCGGINLEYYFSRIDPSVYGCGTKLSHNVCGLLGVGNGLDDDLRIGLPIQTTELHDPIKLLLIIEQSPAIIIKALKANPNLVPWVTNNWINLAALDPNSQELNFFLPTATDFA